LTGNTTTIFCTDIPGDHLREYPNPAPRQELFHMFKDQLVNQQTPWIIVEGSPEQRIQQAIEAIGTVLI
jgi:nicotinamide riboside kinase